MAGAETARALWYVAPGRAEIRPETLGPLAPGTVRVRALHGALSRGTEALILAGRVPESEYPAHARALHGRRVSVPGEVRLRHGRPGRSGPSRTGRPRGVRALSPPDRVRCAGRRRRCRCRTRCRLRARCWPPTWRPRSTRSGTRRPGRPAASPWSARAWSARLIGFLCGAHRRRRGDAGRRQSVAGEIARAFGVNFAKPDAAPGDCELCLSHQRQRRRACDRARSRRRRGDRPGAVLVRRRRRWRCRSAARSTAAA